MNKRFNSRLLALLLAWWLIASFVLPIRAASPEGDAVANRTAEDLRAFSKNCALDTWSRGKTVILAADLDLEGEEFVPIPTFGGTFEGRGHTISGVNLTTPGSTQGLFRYVQPGGVVRDLTVKGTVAPEGTRSTVGGIVGDNAGTLEHCVFQGTVQGESLVGGIAGRNSESGQIVSCTARGLVSGESATGGIAGRNLGLLLKCENSAGVNLTRTETPVDLLDADAGAALEERAAADDEAYHLLSSCSDTGGIAGRSSGVIQGCTNRGTVGYPHVGYNTGGIAGRQDGYLAGCVNTGAVYGRKDVGGIVGQAEPWLVVDPGRDTLEQLRQELDTLDRLIDRALDNAQRTGDDVSARLEAMGGYTDSARDNSKRLLDRVTDFTDETVGTVNTLIADITNALDKMSPALDDLSDAGERLEQLSEDLGEALDSLGGAVDTGNRAIAGLRAAVSDLKRGRKELDAAAAGLREAADALAKMVSGLPASPDPDDLDRARRELNRAFDALREAGEDLDSALTQIQRALDRSGPLASQLGDALDRFRDVSDTAAAIGKLMDRAFAAIGDAVDDLTRKGPAEFAPLGDEARQASDGLFDALAGLSKEMEGLNDVLQSGNDTLTGSLRAINRQFHVIFTLLLNALSDFQDDVDGGIESIIQDTSEEDIAATREGKVADCRNTGAVEGDRNVGGVAGAVSVELDLDPEDDRADLFSLGATYETKAVLQDCVNCGGVAAKKDCVGGIAGRMDLGTALGCQNYGPVSSAAGNYAGGIAGWADAAVRSCYAKSTLSGQDYVGGIAGWGSRLLDCWSIATVTGGSECLGAVAGGVETNGSLRGNRFVDTGLAGVDGVSYAGRAEPVPFEELSQLPGVPPEFTAFTLTLTAEGEVVAQIPFLYGEDLSGVQLPPVPEQEGSYGLWPEFDVSGLKSDVTVEAVYAPWVTVAASQELSGKLSLALAEGRFTQEAVLHVTESGQAPPEGASAEAAVWEVSLTGTELGAADPVPLRLLSPGGKAQVWQYRDGQWRQVESTLNGQYLMLTMEGTQGTFCIQPQGGVPWLVPAVAGGAAALAALLLGLAVSRRKKKAAAARAQKEAEETAAK